MCFAMRGDASLSDKGRTETRPKRAKTELYKLRSIRLAGYTRRHGGVGALALFAWVASGVVRMVVCDACLRTHSAVASGACVGSARLHSVRTAHGTAARWY